ncbi:MAG TPA: alkaline phosphatase family protein [Chloroflexia bacterium]|nr:alkaline phosphatase family protein [Chloroflexia bacterium]
MLRYIWSYSHQRGNTPEHAQKIVQCFAPSKLPVLTTLARAFAICDHWFSSLPGPTWPNRLFVHAGTSAGHVDNTLHPGDYNIDTIYDRLDQATVSWKIYFHDIPQAIALSHLQMDFARARFRLFDEFLTDARHGTLPAYSFIEPRYADFLFFKANDQHPPHDVALGEYLIADVYEALRASPQWEHSLLVILYDEHGGIYDHVPPPPAVNPDGKRSRKPVFGFDRLGVRVPAVLVSPYIPAGTIDSQVYDHTSVLATLEKRFDLAPLTKRDAAAQPFDANLILTSPRTDTPRTLRRPDDPVTAAAYGRMQVAMTALTPDVVRAVISSRQFVQAAASDPQVSLVKLTKNLPTSGEDVLGTVLRLSEWVATEHDAAQLLPLFSSRFFSNVFTPAVTRDLGVAARGLDAEAYTLSEAARELEQSAPRRPRQRSKTRTAGKITGKRTVPATATSPKDKSTTKGKGRKPAEA